ncbi:hypothetical protein MRB53_007288 [Persea americana]|uniref:Uncharacterized protein n=1 Tax=Persea americana TaxID=3435 RepID=A0ACC2MIQ8_PERAE|nr:hypothetical protein MRB53_007288 [Persea americana]
MGKDGEMVWQCTDGSCGWNASHGCRDWFSEGGIAVLKGWNMQMVLMFWFGSAWKAGRLVLEMSSGEQRVEY